VRKEILSYKIEGIIVRMRGFLSKIMGAIGPAQFCILECKIFFFLSQFLLFTHSHLSKKRKMLSGTKHVPMKFDEGLHALDFSFKK
jgi:hypothetical protein